ncbi:MAG TPA: VOC family protein [Steroidobacteraceae bacterium]|nr:VOC family protein [Steroidobacteraceae bacterium]
MLDHIGLRVADYERSKRFYPAALAPPVISLFIEGPASAGFQKGFIPNFWVRLGDPATFVHVAFASDKRDSVDAFYRTALAAGAGDNGPAGLRPAVPPNYYGAFVLDSDGYNIEAACHKPAWVPTGWAVNLGFSFQFDAPIS